MQYNDRLTTSVLKYIHRANISSAQVGQLLWALYKHRGEDLSVKICEWETWEHLIDF